LNKFQKAGLILLITSVTTILISLWSEAVGMMNRVSTITGLIFGVIIMIIGLAYLVVPALRKKSR